MSERLPPKKALHFSLFSFSLSFPPSSSIDRALAARGRRRRPPFRSLLLRQELLGLGVRTEVHVRRVEPDEEGLAGVLQEFFFKFFVVGSDFEFFPSSKKKRKSKKGYFRSCLSSSLERSIQRVKRAKKRNNSCSIQERGAGELFFLF